MTNIGAKGGHVPSFQLCRSPEHSVDLPADQLYSVFPSDKALLKALDFSTVEDTVNDMLDADADEITQAHEYERTEKTGKYKGRAL